MFFSCANAPHQRATKRGAIFAPAKNRDAFSCPLDAIVMHLRFK